MLGDNSFLGKHVLDPSWPKRGFRRKTLMTATEKKECMKGDLQNYTNRSIEKPVTTTAQIG
jgi:hypothetical protein